MADGKSAVKRRAGVRPEFVLFLIALVCLCLFLTMAILCIPYYGSNEAQLSVPEAEESFPEEIEEETIEETVEVTIPPELS